MNKEVGIKPIAINILLHFISKNKSLFFFLKSIRFLRKHSMAFKLKLQQYALSMIQTLEIFRSELTDF